MPVISTDPKDYACKSAMRTPFYPSHTDQGLARIEFWLAELVGGSGQQFQLFYNDRIYIPQENRWVTEPRKQVDHEGDPVCTLAGAVRFLKKMERECESCMAPALPDDNLPAALQSYAAVPTCERILPAFGLICDDHGKLAPCINGRPAGDGLYSDDTLLAAAAATTGLAVLQAPKDIVEAVPQRGVMSMDLSLLQRFRFSALLLVNPLKALAETGDVDLIYETDKVSAWQLLTPFAKAYLRDTSSDESGTFLVRRRKAADLRVTLDPSEHPNISDGRAATFRQSLDAILPPSEGDRLAKALGYAALRSVGDAELPNLLPLGPISDTNLASLIADRATAAARSGDVNHVALSGLTYLAQNLSPVSRAPLLPVAGRMLLNRDSNYRKLALGLFDACSECRKAEGAAALSRLLTDPSLALTDTIVGAYGGLVHDLPHDMKANGLNLLIGLTHYHAPAVVQKALIPLRRFDRMTGPERQLIANVLADRPDEIKTVRALAGYMRDATEPLEPKLLALLARGIAQPELGADPSVQVIRDMFPADKAATLQAALHTPKKRSGAAKIVSDGLKR